MIGRKHEESGIEVIPFEIELFSGSLSIIYCHTSAIQMTYISVND